VSEPAKPALPVAERIAAMLREMSPEAARQYEEMAWKRRQINEQAKAQDNEPR
jgi:hypothetical protein